MDPSRFETGSPSCSASREAAANPLQGAPRSPRVIRTGVSSSGVAWAHQLINLHRRCLRWRSPTQPRRSVDRLSTSATRDHHGEKTTVARLPPLLIKHRHFGGGGGREGRERSGGGVNTPVGVSPYRVGGSNNCYTSPPPDNNTFGNSTPNDRLTNPARRHQVRLHTAAISRRCRTGRGTRWPLSWDGCFHQGLIINGPFGLRPPGHDCSTT